MVRSSDLLSLPLVKMAAVMCCMEKPYFLWLRAPIVLAGEMAPWSGAPIAMAGEMVRWLGAPIALVELASVYSTNVEMFTTAHNSISTGFDSLSGLHRFLQSHTQNSAHRNTQIYTIKGKLRNLSKI